MQISKNRLNMILANKCMTLSDLRVVAGISSQTLAKIRNNQNYEPNTRTLGKIAKALDVKAEELLVEGALACE